MSLEALARSVIGSTGRVFLSRDLDGMAPWLDLLSPVPEDHLERAESVRGITKDRAREALEPLAALFAGSQVELFRSLE